MAPELAPLTGPQKNQKKISSNEPLATFALSYALSFSCPPGPPLESLFFFFVCFCSLGCLGGCFLCFLLITFNVPTPETSTLRGVWGCKSRALLGSLQKWGYEKTSEGFHHKMPLFRNRWGDVFFGSGEETSTAVFSKEFASGLFGCSNRPPGLRRAPPGAARGSSGA